jgi:hypothetical protein
MFDSDRGEEFVTIIAASAGEAMRQFREQGLDRLGYAIVSRIGAHRFSVVEGEAPTDLFGGRTMVAATFSRRTGA